MTTEKLKKVMSIVLEVPETDISESSSPETIENWDSLRHLSLILAIEEEFNIIIPTEKIAEISNFFSLIQIVEKLKHGNSN